MRNATRSVSVAGRESTPAGSGGEGRGRTPLFISRDTPFDEEDEEEHEAFDLALREGRYRLPSVMEREEEEIVDVPEGIEAIGERLLHSSEIEEGVIRYSGGWEDEGESVVLGREEPGD